MKLIKIRGLLIGVALSFVLLPNNVLASWHPTPTPQVDTTLYTPKDKQRFKPTPVYQLGEKLNDDARKYSKVPPPGGFPSAGKKSVGSSTNP